MKRIETILIALLSCFLMFAKAPADRSAVRKGNRAYNLGKLEKAEQLYMKGLGKDSTSVAGNYNLANTFYMEEKYDEAEKYIDKAEAAAVADPSIKADDIYFNKGNLALKQKNYSTAVDAFKQALLRNPKDMDARESYIYAKKMLEDQQNNQDQNNQDQNNQQNQQNQNNQNNQNNQDNQDNQQNQDQNKDQNQQDQNKDKQDQNQDQQNNQNQPKQDNQDQQPQQAPAQGQLSKEAMEQMLKANEAKEKQTQEKVKEQEAMRMRSKQREKNW